MNAETTQVPPPAAAGREQARPPAVWVVRANGGQYADLFIAGGYVAVGWFDLSSVGSLDDIRQRYEQSYSDAPTGQAANETGQIAAFCLHIRKGDYVITPSADRTRLRYGRVTGPCVDVDSEDGCPYRNRRAVDWVEAPLDRSGLADPLRRTLGTPRTVFRVDQSDEFLTAIGQPHHGHREEPPSVGHGDDAPGTPPEVMFNIFGRINTGGMRLNGQEIRHALHPGPVRGYLKQLAASEEFAAATDRSIKPRRMADRECVLRFLAFHVAPWEEYAGGSLDGHLAEVMKKINTMTPEQRGALANDFKKAMRAARRIFGRQAFRKLRSGRVNPISKPLFEAWGVQLARCSSDQIDRLVEQRADILNRFVTLLNQDPEFDKAISLSTSMPQRIRTRFATIRDLVQEFL